MNELEALIAERCRRLGSLPFDEVVDLALYHPDHGFYAAAGEAGRRGDFVTSPEIGPLFGAVVARALDRWWDELDQPDPFVVVEAGAGAGMLARTVLGATPRCASALRYVMVERSARLRARQREHLDLTPPELALGPIAVDAEGLEVSAAPGSGPIVVGLASMPAFDGPVVVLANELLDNLAFALIERTEHGWAEIRVGLDGSGRSLVELPVPARSDLVVLADAVAPDAPIGGRIPVQLQAAQWVRDAVAMAGRGGRVVALDYGATSAELADRPWRDWLRTYVGHARGAAPLDQLGRQDVTADVCVDQLGRAVPMAADRSQAEWLADHGIDELVEQGRAVWAERAHLGDLVAIAARSRIGEAEALTDPSGLGRFRVLEWTP